MLLALALAAALAHEPEACPPLALLDRQIGQVELPPAMVACVREGAAARPGDVRAQWVLLRLDMVADGEPAHRGRALALVARTDDADLLLARAEGFVSSSPALARACLDRAITRSSQWVHAIPRAHRVAKVGAVDAALEPVDGARRWAQAVVAMGLRGPELQVARAACVAAGVTDCDEAQPYPLAPPRALSEQDRMPCRDLGHLWLQAAWGRTYTTERDCLGSVVAQMPAGEGREVAAALLVRLALRHGAPEELAVLVRALGDVLPDVPAVREFR